MKIAAKHVGDVLSGFCGVARVIHKRRAIDDPAIAIVHVRNLGKKLRGCLPPRFFLDLLPALFLDGGLGLSNENVGFEMRIPRVDRAHTSVFPHVFAVTLRCFARSIAAAAFAQIVLSCSENHACRKPLYVPLPWSRGGLVEVIDVKHEMPFRRTEAAEIADVTITAGLHAKPGGRSAGEVEGHQSRGAPKEREGRLAHSSVANGKKVGQASFVSVLQQLDRIRPIGRRFPFSL